eukprot:scaffold34400_cov63-Phaeocystis_antarctica.AAC.1
MLPSAIALSRVRARCTRGAAPEEADRTVPTVPATVAPRAACSSAPVASLPLITRPDRLQLLSPSPPLPVLSPRSNLVRTSLSHRASRLPVISPTFPTHLPLASLCLPNISPTRIPPTHLPLASLTFPARSLAQIPPGLAGSESENSYTSRMGMSKEYKK